MMKAEQPSPSISLIRGIILRRRLAHPRALKGFTPSGSFSWRTRRMISLSTSQSDASSASTPTRLDSRWFATLLLVLETLGEHEFAQGTLLRQKCLDQLDLLGCQRFDSCT